MPIGFTELALILVLVLILFGAGKLPKVMSDLGKGVSSFKKGLNTTENKDDNQTEDQKEEITKEETKK
jgi:sec-independent protein translocase protein TatA